MSSNKKWFMTFGGPTRNFHNAVNRICKQARNVSVFDHIIGYTEKTLMSDASFWKKQGNFITSNASKGYGYWIWKSYLTKKTLERMNDNDVLVYADAGCMINPHGKQRLLEYFSIVNESKFGIYSFQMGHLEKTWTKMDAFRCLDAETTDVMETGQLVGGVYVLRKCPHTVELVDKWYEGCCQYHMLDDSVSANPNNETFRENRHDQSIFSVLRKKHGTEISEFDETWFDPDWNAQGHNYPFWAIRMKY